MAVLTNFAIYWTGTNTYFFSYDTATDIVSETHSPTNIGYQKIPAVGQVIYEECVGQDKIQYKYMGGVESLTPNINPFTVEDDPSCCDIQASQFTIIKTNNTDLSTPNGSFTIESTALNINDFEVSIDGGDTYTTPSDDKLEVTGLSEGTYTLLIKQISGVCFVTAQVSILDIITYPPLIIAETVAPDDFVPVFSPVEFQFELVNNQISIKEDGTGTYLEVDTQDGKDFFASLPIFRILENTDYQGTWQITAVDDVDDPAKFYFGATYTTDQDAIFVPFGRQTFQLFGEVSINNFQKIADISVAPTTAGIYKVRCEGFLQSMFELNAPASIEDLSLGRKFYVIPAELDQASAATIRTGVFSAKETLTEYVGDLIPLGPAPINFINEQTAKGYPVIFSVLDNTSKRVQNIRSSLETEIVTTASEVYIPALPNNTYDFAWINPGGAIADLQIDPALPDWITVNTSDPSVVSLTINTYTSEPGGDYTPDDFSTDYNIFSINAIVGCYQFEFFDGAELLFTLDICVYPAQEIKDVCHNNRSSVPEIFNIAWINREGGWSSFVFQGKKEYGKKIGRSRTFKRGNILKKLSLEEVYDEATVSLSNYSIRELLFISSLRTSIEAYLFNEDTQDWDIPIVLNTQDFPVYKVPFKQLDVEGSFSFLYAEEINIQKQ